MSAALRRSSQYPSDNGTPVARPVRKATGLSARDSRATEEGRAGKGAGKPRRKGESIMKKRSIVAALAAVAVVTTAVYADVIFNPEDGTGFVGKGDVQLALDWNNRQLQQNADDVQFRANSETVTEITWICTNTNNENTQERERTTTTSVEGLVDSVVRERNQITGFILSGYDGNPTIGTPVTDGPAVNSCPSGPWSLTTPAGDPEVISSTGGLQVSINGTDWFDLD
jgi:hypothetical protein